MGGALTMEIGHGTFVGDGRGEVCPRSDGWTPAALSAGLRAIGHAVCGRTIRRAALRGEIPHTATAGGHIRIDPAWVTRTFPQLATLVAA